MTCDQPGGRVAVSEVKGFISFAGKSGVRGRVVSREGNLITQALLAGIVGGFGRGFSANANSVFSRAPPMPTATARSSRRRHPRRRARPGRGRRRRHGEQIPHRARRTIPTRRRDADRHRGRDRLSRRRLREEFQMIEETPNAASPLAQSRTRRRRADHAFGRNRLGCGPSREPCRRPRPPRCAQRSSCACPRRRSMRSTARAWRPVRSRLEVDALLCRRPRQVSGDRPDLRHGGAPGSDRRAAARAQPRSARGRRRAAAKRGSDEAPPQRAAAPKTVSLAGLPANGAIHWGPANGPKVVVFSDFHCGYCKKLTADLKAIGARVEERPISIFGAESRKDAERVLCSPRPEAALHAAYSGLALAIRGPATPAGSMPTRPLPRPTASTAPR